MTKVAYTESRVTFPCSWVQQQCQGRSESGRGVWETFYRWERLYRRDGRVYVEEIQKIFHMYHLRSRVAKSTRPLSGSLPALKGRHSVPCLERELQQFLSKRVQYLDRVRIKPVQTEVILTAEVDKVAMGTNVFAGSKA